MSLRPPISTLFPYTTLFRSLLTSSNDHTAVLWDVESAKQHLILRHGVAVVGASFSPDGGAILTWSEDEARSEEHTSELQSRQYLVCRLLLEKKKTLSLRPIA